MGIDGLLSSSGEVLDSLLMILFGRVMDKAGSVRSKALLHLTAILEYHPNSFTSNHCFRLIRIGSLSNGISLSQLLLKRVTDEKSFVRKQAIILSKVIILRELDSVNGSDNDKIELSDLSDQYLFAMASATIDPIMSIRKLALNMICDLVELKSQCEKIWR